MVFAPILSPSLLLTSYLLASSSNRQTEYEKAPGRKRNQRVVKVPAGKTIAKKNQSRNKSNVESKSELVSPIPQLTESGPRPSYFTCRHSYENTLINEMENTIGNVEAYSPCPGLVRIENNSNLSPFYDPIYALQSIPNAVVVSADSIKNIAKEIYNQLCDELDIAAAPRGSLAIHGLVPGMCKGQRNPILHNRSKKIAEELKTMLKKRFPAARNISVKDSAHGGEEEKWILQLMLQTHNIAIASLSQCKKVGPAYCYWPNWYHPLGLADIDIEEAPSSAYRKLMEALECMRVYPLSTSNVVDLGAAPGGWTSLLRRLNCRVVAVDRSPLDNVLMDDDMVSFVKGDAFTYVPEWVEDSNTRMAKAPPNSWMVSDVIAYPERVTEMLEQWCGNHWVTHLVVTMKFQGSEPSFSELDRAIQVSRSHGYECRVKHFFNNKNEVTLMVAEKNQIDDMFLNVGVLGKPVYEVTLPMRNIATM